MVRIRAEARASEIQIANAGDRQVRLGGADPDVQPRAVEQVVEADPRCRKSEREAINRRDRDDKIGGVLAERANRAEQRHA